MNTWLAILVTLAAYFLLLGRTNYISVTEDKIEILFFNLFGGHTSVKLEDVLKISSDQSYEIETALDFENAYYLFSREYNLDFLDEKGKERSLTFNINNRRKEIE